MEGPTAADGVMSKAVKPRSRRRLTRKKTAKSRATGQPRTTFPVVGIGASAGGLQALIKLLTGLPSPCGIAFVVVQHLDPTHESALASVLSRQTKMSVVEARHNQRLEPDRLYVIPPNRVLGISRGKLCVTNRAQSGSHIGLPIDHFFEELAADRGNSAIGVILSGNGSDGTRGMAAIKAAGGITFAQHEQSAQFPSMPASAIAAGCADFVLPPSEIGRELAGLRGNLPAIRKLVVQEGVEVETAPTELASVTMSPTVQVEELYDFALVGYVALNAMGNIEQVNTVGARMLGRSANKLLQIPLRRLICPSDLTRFMNHLWRCKTSGSREVISVRLKPEDGERPRELELMSARVSASASPVRYRSVMTDVTQRNRIHRWQQVYYGVARVLAEAAQLAEAGTSMLQVIGEGLGWEVGELWLRKGGAPHLEFVAFWKLPGTKVAAFEDETRRLRLQTGEGLPGAVLASGKAHWVTNLASEKSFLRDKSARLARLRSGVAFPIRLGDDILGAIVFYSRSERAPDLELMEMCDSLGTQLGQFLRRLETREALRISDDRLRALVEGNIIGVCTADTRGAVTEANDAFLHVVGYTRAELKAGKVCWDQMTPPEFRSQDIRAVELARRGEPVPPWAKEYVHRDGHRVPVLVGIVPLGVGDNPECVVLLLDQSEQKRFERALRTRERQQAVVARLGQVALAGEPVNVLMKRTARLLKRTLEVDYSKILELTPDGKYLRLRQGCGWKSGVVGQTMLRVSADSQGAYTLRSNTSVVVPDLRHEKRFRGARLLREHGVLSGVSVVIRGVVSPWGVLAVFSRRKRIFTQDDINFLEVVALVLSEALEAHRNSAEILRLNEELENRVNQRTEQLAQTNIELLRQFREREKLEKALIDVAEAEQQRIGQDLHDSLGQQLTGLAFLIDGVTNRLLPKTDVGGEIDELRRIVGKLKMTVAQTRELARGLFPVELKRHGMADALNALAANVKDLFRVPCKVQVDERCRSVMFLEESVQRHLYRIAQEAVFNAAKHSGGQKIWVRLSADGSSVRLKVQDDGKGIDPRVQETTTHLGVNLMQYRARMIGAELKVKSGPRGGTIVTCLVNAPVTGRRSSNGQESKNRVQTETRIQAENRIGQRPGVDRRRSPGGV